MVDPMTGVNLYLPADDVEVLATATGDPTAPIRLAIGEHFALKLPVEIAEQVVDGLIEALAEIARD